MGIGEIIESASTNNIVIEEHETYFFRYTFPIYRSLAIIVLYIGILGANELMYNRYKVNYSTLLDIQFIIKPKRVLKKVVLFLAIFFILFIWYQLEIDIVDESTEVGKVFEAIEKEYLGIVLWIICICFFLFVGRQTCLWIVNTMMQSLQSPFKPKVVPFKLSFATDQLVSLVGPFKDIQYTICYYSSDYENVDQLNECKRSLIPLYIAFFPLVMRLAQCFRNCYEKNDYLGNDMKNAIKYFINIWIFFAVLSTIYSYLWDLKKDWNLGDKKYGFLRDQLLYCNSNYYYSSMAMNFVLRCMWIFTLSGGIVNTFDIKRESFKLLIYLLEVIRRCIWNLLRMENEQINQKIDFTNTSFYNQYQNKHHHLDNSFCSSVEMSILNYHNTPSMKQSLLLQQILEPYLNVLVIIILNRSDIC